MFPTPFRFTADQERLRADVRVLLAQPAVQRELDHVRSSDGPEHARHTYELLGERGWLAADWSQQYGGLGAGPIESAIVAEEMALAGVPDSARVNTIDNIGSTLLAAGTAEQQATYLPPMAKGRLLGCVLYSEPGVGSDLGALRTEAVAVAGGWLLTGTKVWNVGAGCADVGICAARTDHRARTKYAGISLFLVPMRAAGIRVDELSSINPEAFARVAFEDVALPRTALVGAAGQGWQLIGKALGMERTGICFSARAQRWLELVSGLLRRHEPPSARSFDVRLHQLAVELKAARLMVWRCVELLTTGADLTMASASAKWLTSELACRAAELGWELLGELQPEHRSTPEARELATVARESPGLTLAAGTSEMMLATVSSALLDKEDEDEVES